MKKNISIIIFLIWVQIISAQQYNFIQYSISEGLAQSQVYAMLQGSKGYLWFGTLSGGLSRFDGKKFENFSTKDGLASNAIFSIYEDNKNQIWIGTQRGLSKYDGEQFHNIFLNQNTINRVEHMIQKNDSLLWVGTQKGILEYNLNQDSIYKKNIHASLDKSVIHRFYKKNNSIWIGTNLGAFHVDNTVQHFNKNNGLNGNEIMGFESDEQGNIWVLSHDGVNFIQEKTLQIIEKKNIPNTDEAWCIFKDASKKIWIGRQEKGITIFNTQDSTWTKISDQEGLPNKNITSIMQDDWGNIWLGTSGGGVVRYLGQFFVHYDKSEGSFGDRIYAVHENKNNEIYFSWFSASQSGIATYDSLGFQKSEIDSGLLNVKCKALLEDQKGRIWMGTIGKGILVSDTSGVTSITEQNGLMDSEIISMTEDHEGNIWAGTNYEGIFKIKDLDTLGFSIINFNRIHGLKSLRITTIKKGPQQTIWFATRLGEVGYFEKGKLKKIYREEEGLEHDISVRSIAFDDLGNIWVGTAGNGILKAEIFKDSIFFKPINLIKNLETYNIYLLIFDKEGNLWAGNERGVNKLIINKNGIVTDIHFFGKNKGFLGIETCQNSAICDHNGNVWFGTMNGLTQHIPSKQQIKISPPFIHFKRISLFYQPLRETQYKDFYDPQGGIKKGLKLPYHKNSINFEFKAINQSNPDDIQYRWKLIGAEEDWSPLSKKESVDYSNLPPGEYTFEVQALSGKNLLSNPVTASFIIKNPFWELLWFKIVSSILVLGIIVFLLWNWKRKIQIKEKIKRQKLELENHVLQLEQKALQLQMNPHFIFNALNSIQSLVATKDYKTARKEIGNFATLMRSILSNSRNQKINLEEEIKTLEQYLKMEQFCQRVSFDFTISSPKNYDASEIEIPPMLLQPFAENAVIHGISHLEKDGIIQIDFSIKNNLLICEIKDNGVGRKKANELKQSKKPGHQSVAMEVTKERLDALKNDKKYIPLEILDIKNKEGEIKGTHIIVRLPLELDF